jgi:hypothetical protein
MDSVLAPDISTFLIPNVHLTGGIASGLGALLNAIYSLGIDEVIKRNPYHAYPCLIGSPLVISAP